MGDSSTVSILPCLHSVVDQVRFKLCRWGSVADVRLGARDAGVAGDAAAPVEAAAALGLEHAPHRAVPAPAAHRLAPLLTCTQYRCGTIHRFENTWNLMLDIVFVMFLILNNYKFRFRKVW